MHHLPPTARDFLSRFLDTANRTALQRIDWERFYIFVVVCHETASECSQEDLRKVLLDARFRDEEAMSLVKAYSLGRDILKTAEYRGARSA